MRAYILAGGFATRLWPITSSQPKPLLPVGDRPLLKHIIDQIPQEIPVTISANKALESFFTDFLKTLDRPNADLFIEPSVGDQGKRGALLAMSDALQQYPEEDALFIGGDNFFGFNLSDFLRKAEEKPESALIAAHDIGSLEAASSFGVLEVEGENILSFEEKPSAPKSTLIGTFCYYIPAHLISEVHAAAKKTPDAAGALFTHFLSERIPCRAYTFSEYWNDIGSFQDYLNVHIHLDKQYAPKVAADTALHGAVYIDPSATIKNSTIVDSIILGGAHIENSYIDHCVIDRDTIIESAHLVDQAVKQHVKIV